MSVQENSPEEYLRMQSERLKKWAHENYTLPDQRSGSWHPIVLEEMAKRDAEIEILRNQAESWDELQAKLQSIVPLMPDQHLYLHQKHDDTPSPKFMSKPDTVSLEQQEENNGFIETGWY